MFHGLHRVVQTLLLFFRCTTDSRFTHHEAYALGIVGTGGAGLDVRPTLLELADDGLVALLAVDVSEELAIDVVLAFAKMAI